MKLTKLLYQVVKTATDLGDDSFTYLSLITGEAMKNPDYSSSIDKALLNINAFIQRLVALDKLPCQIKDLDVSENNVYDLSKTDPKPRKIVNVFQFTDIEESEWCNFEFRNLGGNKYKVIGYPNNSKKINFQYRVVVPNFDETYIKQVIVVYGDDGNIDGYEFNGTRYTNPFELINAYDEADLDLTEVYGLQEEAVPLCCAYAKAMQNDTDSSLMHALMSETESRMLDIETGETLFNQLGVYQVI